ncbi:MAG: signal peptidase II [Alphaproteobacteria bacterium]|nr:signal peptidase II [Alphaproteobacteria bacterium]MBV9062272.1 signal peptidase II [Alphaproteobacteria bacterium]
MTTRNSARDLGFLAAIAALVLDQATKLLFLYGLHFREMTPGSAVPVLSFFNLVMVWNRGVSYGLFPAHGPWGTAVLTLFSIGAVIGLGLWLLKAHRWPLAIGLGLVIGGAIGNLIDRLIYGRVADFFHFYFRTYDWYVFNVADCAITIGVGALLYDALLRPENKQVQG